MYKGTMTQYIIDDTIYFDEYEYKNWKPRKSGRKPKENSDKYVNRLAEYINCIGIAESTGQVALKEKLFGQLVINKYESILYANGYDKLITEDVMVKLTKKAPKALSLTYIANYTRTIPLDVIKKKLELDTLEIFDNYVILHYDPNGKSYAQTVEERRKEVEKEFHAVNFNSHAPCGA